MTINELIKQLQAVGDGNQPVWMSSDPEGNQFFAPHEVALTGTECSIEKQKNAVVIWPGRYVEMEYEPEKENA